MQNCSSLIDNNNNNNNNIHICIAPYGRNFRDTIIPHAVSLYVSTENK